MLTLTPYRLPDRQEWEARIYSDDGVLLEWAIDPCPLAAVVRVIRKHRMWGAIKTPAD